MKHFKKVCTTCGKIVSQCRCPSNFKEVQNVICEECKGKEIKMEGKYTLRINQKVILEKVSWDDCMNHIQSNIINDKVDISITREKNDK